MEENQSKSVFRKSFGSRSIMKMCIYVVIVSYGTLASTSDNKPVRLAVTADSIPVLTSERTSNVIPEVEVDSFGTPTKNDSKKDISSVPDQLEKPDPSLKLEGQLAYDDLSESANRQSRQSDRPVVPENDSERISVSDPPRTEAESTTIDSVSDTTLKSTVVLAPKLHCETGRCTEITTKQTPDQTSEPTVLETELDYEESSSTMKPTTRVTVETISTTTNNVITKLIVEKTTETIIRSTADPIIAIDARNINETSIRNPIGKMTKVSPTIATVESRIESSNEAITQNTNVITAISLQEKSNSSVQNTQQVTTNPSLYFNKDNFWISNKPSSVVKETTTMDNDILLISTELAITTNKDEYSTKKIDHTQSTTTPIILPREVPIAIAAMTSSTTEMTETTEMPSTIAMITTIRRSTSVPTTTSVVTSATTVLAATTAHTLNASRTKITSSSENMNTRQNENIDITTYNIIPNVSIEDVALFIKIVFQGSLEEVCVRSQLLRQSLANLLNSNYGKIMISPEQVIFHRTQCPDLVVTSVMSEATSTSMFVYIVDSKGNFDEGLTKILPNLYKAKPIEFPLTIDSFTLIQKTESGNIIVIIIISSVVFICIVLLAGLLFLMKKRQGRFNYGERCRPVSLDAYSLDSVSAYNSVRRNKGVLRSSKRSYGNPTFEDCSAVPSHPLNFAGLSSFCNNNNDISEEFITIPQVSSNIDELPAGAELKNRYANVIPLPETRVPLQKVNNDPLTEYINASFIRGPKNANRYYIGCQAPTDNTVSDFWRMIWEQQCKVIIMLTDLVENGVEKCTEYIPPLEVSDCHRLFGDYQVTLKKRETKDKYAISTLYLKNLENNTFREVSHIWYLWPTNGAPTDGSGLISVLLEARALQRGAVEPIVVHCSPGTGRTGTLIALDLGIRQYEITRTVDVPRVVYTIRRDRAGAVQTREQYIFIYKALYLYASKLAGGAIESA